MIKLDLHDFTVPDAVQKFVATFNGHIGDRSIQGILVIHGHRSSNLVSIKDEVRRICERFKDYMDFIPGEQYDGNVGCSFVIPLKRLPSDALLPMRPLPARHDGAREDQALLNNLRREVRETRRRADPKKGKL